MVRVGVKLLLNLVDDTIKEDLTLDDDRLTASSPLLLVVRDNTGVHASHLVLTTTEA